MKALSRVTEALEQHGCTVRGRSAQCPAHEDRAPSLSLGQRKDGNGVVLNCHAGCATEDVVAALRLTLADLFDEPREKRERPQVVAEYPYCDEHGQVLYLVRRLEPGDRGERKTFRQFRPDGTSGIKGIRRVLYRLPEVVATAKAGGTVLVVEGEKDVDNLRKRTGVTATCNVGGVGMGWRDDYTASLQGASEVVVIADRDKPGRKHAATVAESVRRAGVPVRVLEPAEGKDISDHLAAGLGFNDLLPAAEPDPPSTDEDGAPPLEETTPAAPDPENMSSEEYFEASVARLQSELLDTDGLDHIPPLEPLVGDLLAINTVARVVGPSGTFKSFVLLDMCGHVGTGMKWHGHYVRQGLVVYLVAEGEQGIRKRVRAWEQHYGRRMENVRFLPRPIQAMSQDWDVLIEVLRRLRPVLVVVDTQARVTVGVEENSNTEMGRVVDRFDQMQRTTGACIAVVHHTGHVGEHGRGASAVKGTLQSELLISRKGDRIPNTILTIKSGKQKDEDQDGDFQFGLKKISLDGEYKPDGRPVTSLVLVSLDAPQSGPRPAPNGSPEWIVQQLDKAGVPNDYGRRKLRTECQRLGIEVRDEKLQEVANTRRARTAERFPDRFPDLGDETVPGSGTATGGTAGQTGSAPVGNQREPHTPTPVVPSPPLGREPVVKKGPVCVVCTTRLDADWAAQGNDRHVGC